jgi:hypothetical protein
MTTLKQFKEKLNKVGELMIMTDTGEKFELHKHNVQFNENEKVIEIDAASQTYWVSPEKIAYSWVHKEGKEDK